MTEFGSAKSPLRVTVVFGTRPEAIKLAPVARALAARGVEAGSGPTVEIRLVSTGQHDELLDHATRPFALTADVDLAVMRPDQDLYDVAIGCLAGLRQELRRWRPDVTVVEGDTATVFFTAMAAFFERVPLAHVEAGLRSNHKWAPYPEEMFRRLTDTLADYYFAPTRGARDNLLADQVPSDRIFLTGNTVVDAVQEIAASAREGEVENEELAPLLGHRRRLVLVTVHRREVFGERIRDIFTAISRLAQAHSGVSFVYPVHPNRNVRVAASEILGCLHNVHLIEPLSYPDLIRTLAEATLVLTDSGGLQEEAPTFAVPVLVLRDVTERPEGIKLGVARLVGTQGEQIFIETDRLLSDERARLTMSRAGNPYGDGRAAERIADILLHELRGTPRLTQDWT